MTILFVVALVLLIACANIANLLMARATARRHELSVRLALGASKWRLARQLLVESLVMSACGALRGLLVAQWASQLLVRQLSTPNNHVFLDLALDWRVLGFTMAVAVSTALLFGTAPAFRASDVEPMEAIKEHGRGGARDSRVGLANGLVVAQVMLSLVLVVAAGLFVRTFSSLANLHLGFDRDRGARHHGERVADGYSADGPAGCVRTHQRERRSAPGVAAAAVSVVTPIGGMSWNNRIDVSGGVELPERQRLSYFNAITPGWLATFGTPVIAGRDISVGDTKAAPLVMLVNEAFARKFLNGREPHRSHGQDWHRRPAAFAARRDRRDGRGRRLSIASRSGAADDLRAARATGQRRAARTGIGLGQRALGLRVAGAADAGRSPTRSRV